MQNILVINAGSSSIKLAVFSPTLEPLLTAQAAGIGSSAAGELQIGAQKSAPAVPDHAAAFQLLLKGLAAQGHGPDSFAAAGHRVVHGGATLTQPLAVTADVLAQIDACSHLAPLHNPHNAAAIRSLMQLMPGMPQIACFDTAFHATCPEVAQHYAVPQDWHAEGIRRYGFHGLSYAALVRSLRDSGAPLPRRLLACHLGNGASLCAILDGQSVATTMGYSPLEGLTMGTRSGSIDASAVLDRAERHGISATRADLVHRSGLLGLSGHSHDMRAIQQAGTAPARFAVEHFCYWIVRHAGSMLAAMQGADAIAFTGGIGENAPDIRERVVRQLAWAGLGPENTHVIPAQEERQIALHTRDILATL
ncbi:acetate/propionate family kinase [Nocardioides marinus]|nr:acetate/propionate family kinase [Nocardioides marinus]